MNDLEYSQAIDKISSSSFKLQYETEVKKVEISGGFEELQKVAKQRFPKLPENFLFYYEDIENEQITVESDYDLSQFVKDKVQKLFIKPGQIFQRSPSQMLQTLPFEAQNSNLLDLEDSFYSSFQQQSNNIQIKSSNAFQTGQIQQIAQNQIEKDSLFPIKENSLLLTESQNSVGDQSNLIISGNQVSFQVEDADLLGLGNSQELIQNPNQQNIPQKSISKDDPNKDNKQDSNKPKPQDWRNLIKQDDKAGADKLDNADPISKYQTPKGPEIKISNNNNVIKNQFENDERSQQQQQDQAQALHKQQTDKIQKEDLENHQLQSPQKRQNHTSEDQQNPLVSDADDSISSSTPQNEKLTNII